MGEVLTDERRWGIDQRGGLEQHPTYLHCQNIRAPMLRRQAKIVHAV